MWTDWEAAPSAPPAPPVTTTRPKTRKATLGLLDPMLSFLFGIYLRIANIYSVLFYIVFYFGWVYRPLHFPCALRRRNFEKPRKPGCAEWWQITSAKWLWMFPAGSKSSGNRRTKITWPSCSWIATGRRTLLLWTAMLFLLHGNTKGILYINYFSLHGKRLCVSTGFNI